MDSATFMRDGVLALPGLLATGEVDALRRSVEDSLVLATMTVAATATGATHDRKAERAGTRSMLHLPWCRSLAARLRTDPRILTLLPEAAIAVQCNYFEKSATRNWLVSPHQDLSLPVATRVEHPELRGWSEKEGGLYVQPPAAVLEQVVAVRLHLDTCGSADGPLRVVRGSHLAGRLDAPTMGLMASAAVGTAAEATCFAAPGDAWVMRPLAIHASSKSSGTSQRRVLHLVFGPRHLPYGLNWPDDVAHPSPEVIR